MKRNYSNEKNTIILDDNAENESESNENVQNSDSRSSTTKKSIKPEKDSSS